MFVIVIKCCEDESEGAEEDGERELVAGGALPGDDRGRLRGAAGGLVF